MTLIAILFGTLVAGIGSVWLAAMLSFGVLARYTQHLLSLAAGALLGTAFMHLLPEAFEGAVRPQGLFMTLLIGVVFFFLLDKAELWHHGHEHHHEHEHEHEHREMSERIHGGAGKQGGWVVLAGDSVHCFGDGVLIASAFMADLHLGAIAAVAVLAHEVPHHMGDLAVLRNVGGTRQAAVAKVTLAGAVTALGGLTGWWLVDLLHEQLRYFLVVASSSFIYVALADLIPQLQKHLGLRATLAQVAWLLGGVALVTFTSSLGMHGH